MASQEPISVLFVCLGNICRSPMAEAIFRHRIASLPANTPLSFSTIDSAGTGAYHVSSPPDHRTMSTLRAHNITDYTHSARKIRGTDFINFDYILAMDSMNLEDLLEARTRALKGLGKGKGGADGDEKIAEVRLIGDYLPDGGVVKEIGGGEEVGDPYYGGKEGFEGVYRQVGGFVGGFLKYLEKERGT
ncbi:hypothetical protein AJ79_09353 [Helicocarpus griseus UAMH5409]|uniref:Phosphotyrosine protein phosphatase I domain-containing protein n=1 Tax=Helicocarpus griseus UAMH5409 TaxID=1447875 RepID=A0A2B7WKM6_9EURO|nr:hypothetical protein AJ79_09353 [Helicocarpus griseus UAMH5409]